MKLDEGKSPVGEKTSDKMHVTVSIVSSNVSSDPKKLSTSHHEKGDHYNPHQHRMTKAATTNLETLIHLMKGSLGTGILAMPNAFLNSGLLVGSIGTILIGVLLTYCLHLLINTQYKMCKQMKIPLLPYPKTLEVALSNGPNCLRWASRHAGKLINSFLLIYQLGVCCVYIVFVSTNISQVANFYLHNTTGQEMSSEEIKDMEDESLRFYALMLLVPLILLNWVRNLKLLAPFSSLANIITFVGLGITLYYIFSNIHSPAERNLVGNVANFPLFVGTTLFALEAVGVIISLENNMQSPASFVGYTGVLNQGMATIVFLYIFVGFSGYCTYGELAKGSVTLNLPEGDILAQSVRIMFAASIFVSYALQCYVAIEIIWIKGLKKRFIKTDNKKRIFIEYCIRTVIVIGTCGLAIAIPRLELFISLFGAFCLSALGIIFPGLIELCFRWETKDFGKLNWILAKDLFLIIIGIFALIIGTYTSLKDIIVSMM